MYKPKKIILTASPSINAKEIAYVSDAVKNGWNFQFNDYVEKFEKAVSSYVGVKHEMATSSGTRALHFTLLAMGIKEGDEVILPEISTVAEILAEENCDVLFCRIGVQDTFTSIVGSIDYLMEYNGLSVEKITKKILESI